MIPKIDHSGIDPGYYEHNLNEVKSNKDLMMRQYSKAREFAKEFVKQKKGELESQLKFPTTPKIAIGGGGGGGSEDFINLNPSPAPSHHPSRSTEHNKKLLTGLNIDPISPIKITNESDLENKFLRDFGKMDDEFDNLTKDQEKIDERNIQKNKRHKKFKEMAGKFYNNEISKNILKGAKEVNERRQQIKTLQKNNAAKKITKAIKSGVDKIKANKPLSDSTVNFLEELESESESESESETKPPKQKKLNKTDEARETAKKLPPLTPDKLNEVIAGLKIEIENLDQYKDKQKITKDYADQLNDEFAKYGIVKQFRVHTSVKIVKKKFKDDYELQQTEHKIRGLETISQSQEKAKKAESI
jgi:hypothetical protein